jgi:hypothetical protein
LGKKKGGDLGNQQGRHTGGCAGNQEIGRSIFIEIPVEECTNERGEIPGKQAILRTGKVVGRIQATTKKV